MTPALWRAYRRTCYQAGGASVFAGRRSPSMDALLTAARARQAVFVTAFNPMSRKMPPGWNARMQRALARSLWRWAVLPGTGQWRQWSEGHILVFAGPRPVWRLARRFRQNAIVVVCRGRPARLKLRENLDVRR